MIEKLLLNKKAGQTIFTFSEISILTNRSPDPNLISAINYYVKNDRLIRLSKGIYSINRNYSRYEFGNKLRTPSYISLYSVLSDEGVIFQKYSEVFLIANRAEEKNVDGQVYKYRKIKDEILYNRLGVIEEENISIAVTERALLDKIYLDGDEYFDNLSSIDLGFCKTLNDQVYKSKKVNKFLVKLRKNSYS